VKQFLDSRLR